MAGEWFACDCVLRHSVFSIQIPVRSLHRKKRCPACFSSGVANAHRRPNCGPNPDCFHRLPRRCVLAAPIDRRARESLRRSAAGPWCRTKQNSQESPESQAERVCLVGFDAPDLRAALFAPSLCHSRAPRYPSASRMKRKVRCRDFATDSSASRH